MQLLQKVSELPLVTSKSRKNANEKTRIFQKSDLLLENSRKNIIKG